MAITTPAGSSRRDFIRLTGTLGMAAGLAVSLAACGGKGKASGGAKASGMAADQEVTHKDGVITAGISYELAHSGGAHRAPPGHPGGVRGSGGGDAQEGG